MIKRNIKEKIVKSLNSWPITLVTGSRQIGKTTICKQIAKEKDFHYVSLDNLSNREKAINNPKGFIDSLNAKKLIIDEIQYVPKLFDVLTSIVNKTKFEIGEDKAYGMFIITGSNLIIWCKV